MKDEKELESTARCLTDHGLLTGAIVFLDDVGASIRDPESGVPSFLAYKIRLAPESTYSTFDIIGRHVLDRPRIRTSNHHFMDHVFAFIQDLVDQAVLTQISGNDHTLNPFAFGTDISSRFPEPCGLTLR